MVVVTCCNSLSKQIKTQLLTKTYNRHQDQVQEKTHKLYYFFKKSDNTQSAKENKVMGLDPSQKEQMIKKPLNQLSRGPSHFS